ncbi:MAG: cytosine permease [Kiritimatiellae bacterium]|nr:cytosine permease [Kiritimatiellia bacterium]
MHSEYEFSPVAAEDRRGFWAMLAVMVGFTFFSASMWAGATLGTGLRASSFLLAVLAGNVLLGAYTGLLAWIAARTGRSTHLLARQAFGERGAALPSLLLGVTQVGWFGVGVAMFALPVGQLFPQVPHLALLWVAGALMTLTAYYGIQSLTILSIVAVPAIALLGSASVAKAFADFGGISAWFAQEPAGGIGLGAAIGICVGSFISGGTLTPDFTRFARTPRIAVSTTVTAFLLGNSLMFLFGAVAAAFYGTNDISEVMMKQGLIGLAVLVLGLNIWTTNDNALYAASLGFATLARWPKRRFVLLNGFIGTLFATAAYNHFVPWLNLLNRMLPSIGAVLILDHFVVRRGGRTPPDSRPVHWPAIIAWACGFAAAQFLPGIAPLNTILASSAAYLLLARRHTGCS